MNNFVIRSFVSLIFAPIVLVVIFYGGFYFKSLLMVIAIIGVYEIFLLKKTQVKLFIAFFFLIFLYILYSLRIIENHSNNIIICLLVTWLSDIGGFIFGKIIGGKKINIISPNKTYAGFFGALFLPQILNIYLYSENYFVTASIYYYLFFILLLSTAAILGDLFFSYMKRLENIKDYSNLIPGHGGLFDRIDGLIFVIILFFLLFGI